MQNIEVFETEIANHYAIDGYTNMIIPVNENLAELIKSHEELDRDMIYHNSSMNLKNMMDKWPLFMKNERVFDYKTLKRFRLNQFPQLILNVTENCNLRCLYCIYNGENPGFRDRSKKSMPYEIATQSIDRFIEFINKNYVNTINLNPAISFYGGEPLLEFDLIKAVVNYCKKINFKANFNMTTNATLLNEDKIKYLVDNDIMISISLDGPRGEHDRNRPFANGKGSYKIVYNNILKLKEEIINQGKELKLPCGVLVTITHDTDLIKLNEYFCNDMDSSIDISRVSMENSTRDTCKPFVFSNFSNTFLTLQALYKAKRLNRSKSDVDMKFFKKLFDNTHGKITKRYVSPYGDFYGDLIGGGCVPGHKISVSHDGLFHLCERVSENFPIGNCKTGFDEQKSETLLTNWSSAFLKHCRNCAFKGICRPCEQSGANYGVDRFELDEFCKDVKPSILSFLQEEFSVLEALQDPQGYLKYNSNNNDIFNFAA
jgi:uncharacterized protein